MFHILFRFFLRCDFSSFWSLCRFFFELCMFFSCARISWWGCLFVTEPANFGTNDYDVWYSYSSVYPWSLLCPNSPLDLLENPPYIPKSLDTPSGRLSDKTICMTAQQFTGEPNEVFNHYDVHNLYGHSQITPSFEYVLSSDHSL